METQYSHKSYLSSLEFHVKPLSRNLHNCCVRAKCITVKLIFQYSEYLLFSSREQMHFLENMAYTRIEKERVIWQPNHHHLLIH